MAIPQNVGERAELVMQHIAAYRASMRAGHALDDRWFHPLWQQGWKEHEWQSGLNHAAEQGYWEVRNGKFFLTETGYQAYF